MHSPPLSQQPSSKSEPTASRGPVPTFPRFTKEAERKEFYQTLTGPKWWIQGKEKDHSQGWAQIFERNEWKCLYCSKDLAASTDALAESTEEHLVPRSLLEANG